jgi:hypothetical protein
MFKQIKQNSDELPVPREVEVTNAITVSYQKWPLENTTIKYI